MSAPASAPSPTVSSAARGYLLFGSLIIAGFVVLVLGWRVAAATLFVPYQVPALVSGGIGGLFLVVLGAGLLYVHAARDLAARENDSLDDLLDEMSRALEARAERKA